MGPAANDAVPALAQLLGDEEAGVRAAAATALGQLGPTANAAAGPLRAILVDPEPSVRKAAAEALLKIRRAGNAKKRPQTNRGAAEFAE